jgi:hypothetical protein
MSIKIITISDGFGSETVPSITDPVASQVFHYTLTSTDITNTYVQLPVAPNNPNSGMLYWLGISQQYGADFNLTGTRLYFLPNLLPKLTATDFISLYYQ